MVEAKAIADNEKGGCNVSISIEGHEHEILEETLALVQGVMGSLKDQSFVLHLAAIKAIADNSEILFGEEVSEEDVAKDFERLVATAKFREGIN